MQTITFFATKGGAGRTVSTMALASGFLAMGKRVLVLDCTDEAKADPRRDTPTTLQRWRKAMSSSGVLEDRLQLLACTTREEVEDMLASAKTDGFDVALIDTRTPMRSSACNLATHSMTFLRSILTAPTLLPPVSVKCCASNRLTALSSSSPTSSSAALAMSAFMAVSPMLTKIKSRRHFHPM